MNYPPPLPPPPPPAQPETCVAQTPQPPFVPVPFTAGEPPDFIQHLINDDCLKFEEHVLAVLVQNPAFVDQVAPVLGVNPCVEKTRFPVLETWNDFSRDESYALYACLLKYRQSCPQREIPGRDLVETILNQLAQEPHGVIGPSEVEGAMARFDQALTRDLKESTGIVGHGFIYWLGKQRMAHVVKADTALPTWNPVKLNEKLAVHFNAIGQLLVNDEEDFVAFDKIVSPPAVELIPSGLRACDDSLGGGFGKGEFSLIIAPSGGGKTVFGTQLAARFAQRGCKVLFITTEQAPDELKPRIISNVCGIPFERLRGGVVEAKLMPAELDRYHKLMSALGAHLHFANWGKDRSRSIRGHLRAEIERFSARRGGIDVLIFDWIGAALGARSSNDSHALRLAYQDTGDALGDIARDLGIVVIGFGQAAMGSTRGKKRIDQDDIAECKSLGRSATNVIGMSALREDPDDDGPNYARVQHLFVSKARKSAGGCRRFRREFEFQRLADL